MCGVHGVCVGVGEWHVCGVCCVHVIVININLFKTKTEQTPKCPAYQLHLSQRTMDNVYFSCGVSNQNMLQKSQIHNHFPTNIAYI
jgi:hypothetical protein